MSNSDVLELLRNQLEQAYGQALKKLDKEIEGIKAKNAANGLLRSGATIKQVRDRCKVLIEELAKQYVASCRTQIDRGNLENCKTLVTDLKSIFTDIISKDVAFARKRISNVLKLIKNEALFEKILPEIVLHYEESVDSLDNDIKLAVVDLRKAQQVQGKMPLKERFENNPAVFGLTLIVIGFAAGFSVKGYLPSTPPVELKQPLISAPERKKIFELINELTISHNKRLEQLNTGLLAMENEAADTKHTFFNQHIYRVAADRIRATIAE